METKSTFRYRPLITHYLGGRCSIYLTEVDTCYFYLGRPGRFDTMRRKPNK